MATPYLIFVPGIMGTELWDKVIRVIEGTGFPELPVYKGVLSYIESRLGYPPDSFLAFPYDWRASNVTSAAHLGAAIRSN